MENPARLSIPVGDLPTAAGKTFGPSSWRLVSQPEIDAYAELSEDRNPIHIDPAAAAASPYGATIAHGFFTLGLVVPLMAEVFEVTGASMGINYGLNKLRFPAPVPVGARVRLSGEIAAVSEVVGGYQIEPIVTFELESNPKPVVVAEMLLRYYR